MSKDQLSYWETPAGEVRESLDGTDYSQAPALSGYHPTSNFKDYTVRNDIRNGKLWHSAIPGQDYIQLTAQSPRWGQNAQNLMTALQFSIARDPDNNDYYLVAYADPRVVWNHIGRYQLYRYEMHEAPDEIEGRIVNVITDQIYWIDKTASIDSDRYQVVKTSWRWIP